MGCSEWWREVREYVSIDRLFSSGKSPGKDKTYVIEFSADGKFHMSLDYFGSWTIEGPWTQDHLEVKGHDLRPSDGMPGMNGAEVNLKLTADGQHMEGEWHKKGGKKYGLVFQRDSSTH